MATSRDELAEVELLSLLLLSVPHASRSRGRMRIDQSTEPPQNLCARGTTRTPWRRGYPDSRCVRRVRDGMRDPREVSGLVLVVSCLCVTLRGVVVEDV